MARPLSAPKAPIALSQAAGRLRAALLWGVGGFAALLLAGALALWFHYGTAVFFETIAAGLATCF